MNRNMEAITWSLHARGISPTAFRLLIQLCSFVNSNRDDFEVWPSHKLLAEKVEISISGVKRHLNELIEAGYLEARAGMRGDGGKSSNVYSISVRSEHQLPDGGTVQIDPTPPGQIDPSPSASGEPSPQVTVDLCKEPLESGTSEILNNPPLPSEEDTPTGDLFGGQEIVTAKPSIIEYVAERWSKLCDDFPRTHRVIAWSDSRKKGIARRAAEIVAGSHGAFDAYQVWDMMFEAIRNDRWLRGQGEPSRDYPTPFALDIDYILRPKVFTRTLEKAATNDRDSAATHDPISGREYGPAEQAARRALSRYLAGR